MVEIQLKVSKNLRTGQTSITIPKLLAKGITKDTKIHADFDGDRLFLLINLKNSEVHKNERNNR